MMLRIALELPAALEAIRGCKLSVVVVVPGAMGSVYLCLLDQEDRGLAMRDGMVGTDIGFDATTAVGIALAAEGMTKAEVMMEMDSGIEEFGRY
jgi:hypothetical protein